MTATITTALEANIAGIAREMNQCPICKSDTFQAFSHRVCVNCTYGAELDSAEEYALRNPDYKG